MTANRPERFNHRHKSVTLSVMVLMASSLAAGCSHQQQCVDANGNPLPDNACRSTSTVHYNYPHWIYRSGSSFGGGNYGTTVRGGFGGFHGFGGG